MFLKCLIDVFIYTFLFLDLATGTSEQDYHWLALNAIENVAYGKDVEVPDFVWRWFSTGID
jgi:hypothetical protein